MEHEYDIFERFADGSTLWRDSVFEFETALIRLADLAETSKNGFYAIDLSTGEVFTVDAERSAPKPIEPPLTWMEYP